VIFHTFSLVENPQFREFLAGKCCDNPRKIPVLSCSIWSIQSLLMISLGGASWISLQDFSQGRILGKFKTLHLSWGGKSMQCDKLCQCFLQEGEIVISIRFPTPITYQNNLASHFAFSKVCNVSKIWCKICTFPRIFIGFSQLQIWHGPW
jgi:hypothetical protein